MKNIFRFLLTLLFGTFFLQATMASFVEVPGGKVRYAIELKKLSKQEAQQAVSQGYIDLWSYALFNQAFVDEGYITLTSDGSDINEFLIQMGLNTISYKIIDKQGVYDNSGTIAAFAPYENKNCPTRTILQPGTGRGGQPFDYTRVYCPVGSYGGSSRSSSSFYEPSSNTEILEINGEKWYALRLHIVRFEYKQAASFYATLYKDAGLSEASNGASNFNMKSDDGNDLVWEGFNSTRICSNNPDWSMTYTSPNAASNTCPAALRAGDYDFIRGGVEIIADPEFILTASATCGGSDLQGTFKVNNWNGKDWSDYKAVKMYVNTNGGTRKALATGSDLVFTGTALCNASGVITATGTTADFNYSLSPSAYMMNGAPADSLIWAFEDIKITLI